MVKKTLGQMQKEQDVLDLCLVDLVNNDLIEIDAHLVRDLARRLKRLHSAVDEHCADVSRYMSGQGSHPLREIMRRERIVF